MNKHRHRIVFNRARGLFMAVAECAGTHQAGQSVRATRSVVRGQQGQQWQRGLEGLSALTVGLMLAWGAILLVATGPAQAQIKADSSAPANQRPNVTQAANGVPLVNIQAPSAAGVSRNVYTQFDVQQSGVILNNSSSNVQTQLGGWVQGNPWMTAGGARIILNEVRADSPSQLKGFMEVAGPRAQVIVANPAGITCDGCGFINAYRGTLTTGVPILQNGNLDGYRVTGGTIHIEGAGLQGQSTDYTDLISRAVKVNAGIWAQHLAVTTGVNQVSADQSSVTPLGAQQATDATPAFALDTSLLGGMYAGRIVLVGTESGLGMRNAGHIGAHGGALTLSHAGDLTNTGTLQASTALALQARTLDNAGEIAAQTTSVTAGTLHNTGLIDGQDTTVRATTLNNVAGGRIYGDHLAVAADTLVQTAQDDGGGLRSPVLAARQRLDIGAQAIENNEHAWIYSLGDMSIGGSLDGNGQATGTATRLDNLSGTIEASGDLFLNVATLRNINTRFATATQNLPTQTITEYAGSGSPNRYAAGTPEISTYSSGGSTHLATPEGNYEQWLLYQYTRSGTQSVVTDSAPAHIMAGGDLHIQVGNLLNDNSRILAGADLISHVGFLNNQAYMDGQQITQDGGQVTSHWRERYCSFRLPLIGCVDHSWRTGRSTTAYAPAPDVKQLELSPLVYAGQTQAATLPDAPVAGSLPGRGLLITNPVSAIAPLIEVDPRFADMRQWLSSDYMLRQLSFDPATVQKRLGDGFYEQSLVRDQVAQLTGRRFLDGYSNEEAQYRALLDSGVTLARELNLRPGVALSAEQVAQLTSDVVWLETTTVMLKGPDGQDQAVQVLTPRLYLAPRAGDLQADGVLGGTLMGARNIDLQVRGDLVSSGGIGASQSLNVQADNIRIEGGQLSGLGVDLRAAQDILNLGGQVGAVHDLTLLAGRDVRLASTTASSANAQGSATYVDRVASLYASGPGAQVTVVAQRDLTLQAASVAQQGGGGGVTLAAGRDLTLGAVQASRTQDIAWNARNHRHDATQQDVGSAIVAQGDIRLAAGRDLTAQGGVAQTDLGSLEATAAGSITLDAGQQRRVVDEAHHHTSRDLLSKRTVITRDQVDSTVSQGAAWQGQSVALQAGQDIVTRGASLASAQGQTTLDAGRDVQVLSAQNSHSESHYRQEKKSGVSASLSGGVSVGSSRVTQTETLRSTTQAGSSVSGASVGMEAQRDAQIRSSMVLADQDIRIQAGRNLDITAADNTQETTSRFESRSTQAGLIGGISPNQTLFSDQAAKQNAQETVVSQSTSVLSANSGNLTLIAGADEQHRGTGQGNARTEGADLLAGQEIRVEGNDVTLDAAVVQGVDGDTQARQRSTTVGAQLSGTVGSRITSAVTMARESERTDNERLANAQRLKAGYDAYKLTQGVNELVAAGGKPNATDSSTGSAFGISVSLGTSRSEQQSSYDSTQVRGTNAQASTIDVKSRDADITAVGAKLQATDISLDAAGNLNLLAAQNTASQHSSSKGSNASIGATIGFGEQSGISFQVGVGGNLGKANGSETTHDNTLITATDQVTLKSGADTTLAGAQVAGDTVKADVGGKLDIATQQDSSHSESKQSSFGVNLSLCIPPLCVGNAVTGSANVSKSGFNHNYQSAVGQSGIAAGEGGFDIKVQGDTSLTGAAITSTAAQSRNSLQTASLSNRDLDNRQDTKSHSSSVGVAYGGGSAASTLAANTASNVLGNVAASGGLPKNGSERSQTKSVISPATVTITGSGDAQKDQGSAEVASTLTSRDASTANGALTNTLTLQQVAEVQKDMQRAQENAQAGQLVGSVAFNVAGDIAASQKWADGSPQKIALHGVAGLIQATAGGQNGAAGALAAMGNEALTRQINDYIAQQVPINSDMTPAQASQATQARKELAEAAASMLGATTVALAGGKAQDVQLGGQVALNADRFNRQLHPNEKQRIEELAKKKAQETCRGDASCERQVNLYWTDMLERAAEGRTDTQEAIKNQAYYEQIVSAAGKPGTEASMGASERFFQNLGEAQRMLNADAGKLILDSRGNVVLGTDGKPQTYFSTTQAQRDDPYGNIFPGGSPSTQASVIPGKDQRDQARQERLNAHSGAAEPDYTLESLVLGDAVLGKLAKAIAGSVVGSASKSSASDYIPASGKKVSPAVDGQFATQGLTRNPLDFPEGIQMVNMLEKTGMSQDAAIREARAFINSGKSLPVATPLDTTDKLVKVVPAGGSPSPSTGYWMKESELVKLQSDPASMANKLGLPPGMQVNSFDIYQITPKQGAVVFESKIAPTTVNGAPNTSGGATQSLVLDRSQFTLPVKVGNIVINK